MFESCGSGQWRCTWRNRRCPFLIGPSDEAAQTFDMTPQTNQAPPKFATFRPMSKASSFDAVLSIPRKRHLFWSYTARDEVFQVCDSDELVSVSDHRYAHVRPLLTRAGNQDADWN
jgi:hypothetical protein